MKIVRMFIAGMAAVVFSGFIPQANTYKVCGKISSVRGNIVTVDTDNGNRWEFLGDGYYTGQSVMLVMDTNNTANLYDDIIVNVK